MSFGQSRELGPKEECQQYVKNLFVRAEQKGETSITIKTGSVIQGLHWDGRHRVVSGVLLDVCAIFHDAGNHYKFNFVGFPNYTNKIDNTYGSIDVKFDFPSGADLYTLLSRPVKSGTLETVKELFIHARIEDALAGNKGHDAKLAAEKFVAEQSKLY